MCVNCPRSYIETSVIKERNPSPLILSGTTPVKLELNMRQNWIVNEGIMPSFTSPLGILCIGDPFRDIEVESGT